MRRTEKLSAMDRQAAIVDVLVAQESAPINELAVLFGVSHMTIRRDLEVLEGFGRVTVGRGEARLAHYSGVEPRYAAKQRMNALRKAQIARYAAEHLVSDGDVILLEGGTTVTAMARYLDQHHGLTVITNGMYTVNELARLLPDATIISTGGVLRDVSFTYVGPQVDDMLATIHGRTVFVSATGFTLKDGLTDPNPLEVQVRRRMVRCADRVVALLDSTKFGVVSTVCAVKVDEVDVFVTDADAPPRDVAQLRKTGADVRVVDSTTVVE
jgi:DeoR/GlpR family transcriptional regulator of sugar metabolism